MQWAALRSIGDPLKTVTDRRQLVEIVPDSRQEDNDLDERPFDRFSVNWHPC